MIKLAALLLTCDLVNPYHERKHRKKRGLREREVKEQGQEQAAGIKKQE